MSSSKKKGKQILETITLHQTYIWTSCLELQKAYFSTVEMQRAIATRLAHND